MLGEATLELGREEILDGQVGCRHQIEPTFRPQAVCVDLLQQQGTGPARQIDCESGFPHAPILWLPGLRLCRPRRVCHHRPVKPTESHDPQAEDTLPPRPPLRVLVVSTTYPRFENDHRPRFVADLCEHLVADHGLRVTAVAPHAPGLRRHETIRGVAVERFRYALDPERQCIAYGPGVVDNLRQYRAARWQLPGFVATMTASVLRRLPDHDLIHAHWIQPAVVAMLANAAHRRPLVLTVHRLADGGRLQRFALARADRVLFNSSYTLQQAEAQACRFRGEVAYQGFDASIFGQVARRCEMRRRLGIPESARVIAAVARMVRFKGLHVLLAAAEPLLSERPDTHIVLAGDGPERPELERIARRLPQARRIHFPGSLERPDIARLLADSDLFVNPGVETSDGRVETLGIATLEAAACGLPCVGTRVGGIPETIEHRVTGLLTAADDVDGLVQAVGALLDDPERRAAMGQAARERAFRSFTWEALACRVTEIYRQLLQPPAAKRLHSQAAR